MADTAPFKALGDELMRLRSRSQYANDNMALSADMNVPTSTSSLSLYFNGKRKPKMPRLRELARLLNGDIDLLAKLGDYEVHETEDDRADIPGWGLLDEEEQAGFRRTIAAVVRNRRQPTPPGTAP